MVRWYMSSVDNLSRELLLTMEGIAKLLSAGTDLVNIARQTNLDVPTVDGLVAREEFHAVFAELDPSAYGRWVDDQGDLTARRAVKNMARADSQDFYKEIRNLVKTSDQLRDLEKINTYLALMKIGGVADKDGTEQERVTLTAGSLNLLSTTLKELDGFFRK